jgi:hypothetical protein
MDTRVPKPSWWQLYALMALIGAMLFAEADTNLTVSEHRLVEIIIVLVGFAALCLWLLANAVTLEYEDIEAERTPNQPASWQAPYETAQRSDLTQARGMNPPADRARNKGRSNVPHTRSSLN